MLLEAAFDAASHRLRLTFDRATNYIGPTDSAEVMDADGNAWKLNTLVAVGGVPADSTQLIFSTTSIPAGTDPLETLYLFNTAAFVDATTSEPAADPVLPFACPTTPTTGAPQLIYAHWDGLGLLDLWFDRSCQCTDSSNCVQLVDAGGEQWGSASADNTNAATGVVVIGMADNFVSDAPPDVLNSFDTGKFENNSDSTPAAALSPFPFPVSEE